MDFWIIVFAMLAFIAILGWIVNAAQYYRKPPMSEEYEALLTEMRAKTQEVEGLISEACEALAKVIEALPTEEGKAYFDSNVAEESKERLRSYGFYRTGT